MPRGGSPARNRYWPVRNSAARPTARCASAGPTAAKRTNGRGAGRRSRERRATRTVGLFGQVEGVWWRSKVVKNLTTGRGVIRNDLRLQRADGGAASSTRERQDVHPGNSRRNCAAAALSLAMGWSEASGFGSETTDHEIEISSPAKSQEQPHDRTNLTSGALRSACPAGPGSAPHCSTPLGLSASAALVASMALAAPAAAQQTADSIWSGGPILTMNDKAMRAEAVAVANGKIIAVGKRSEVMKLKGPATQLVDLKGRTLVPGFVDAHGHIVVGGLQALSANLLAPPDGKVQDIASLQQTLRDWVRRTPPPSRRPRSSSASATTTRSSRNCATRPRKNWTPSRRTSPSSSSTSPGTWRPSIPPC